MQKSALQSCDLLWCRIQSPVRKNRRHLYPTALVNLFHADHAEAKDGSYLMTESPLSCIFSVPFTVNSYPSLPFCEHEQRTALVNLSQSMPIMRKPKMFLLLLTESLCVHRPQQSVPCLFTLPKTGSAAELKVPISRLQSQTFCTKAPTVCTAMYIAGEAKWVLSDREQLSFVFSVLFNVPFPSLCPFILTQVGPLSVEPLQRKRFLISLLQSQDLVH